MDYKQKYLKYINKYLELKQKAGAEPKPKQLKDIPPETLANALTYIPSCKETIRILDTTKQATNYPWDPNLININIDGIIFNKINRLCDNADNPVNCNLYINKCRLQHLYNKYNYVRNTGDILVKLATQDAENSRNQILFTHDIVNQILLYTIPNNNNDDRTTDVADLMAFGANVDTIGQYYFSYNYLTNVTIPHTVTTIGLYAFRNNQLTNVTIPHSVTTIGQGAFAYNQLKNVIISNSVITIGQVAFIGNQLKNVIIPESVITIGQEAFMNNQLTSVTIPNSVITIGGNAFANNQITSVTMPIRFKNRIDMIFIGPNETLAGIPKFNTNLGGRTAFEQIRLYPRRVIDFTYI